MANTLTTKTNGYILINSQPFQIGNLDVKFIDDNVIVKDVRDLRIEILNAAYTEITDPSTGEAFASMNALKTFVLANFFFQE